MYPILPYIAFICVSGWAQIIRRLAFSKQAITLGIVFALVLLYFVFEMSLYMTLSFGFPFPQIERKVLELPNIGDITILDTSSTYPVKRVSYDKWPVEQIAHDMYSYAEDQGNLTFFFLPNLEYFNDNNVALELTRHRAVNVSLQRGLEKKNFDTEGELLDYVNKYTQFIYLEGPFSPDFLWNKKLFEQIQSEIQKRRINEELQTVKTYHLPNKQTVYWLKKVK
jgi:hypothetical protein